MKTGLTGNQTYTYNPVHSRKKPFIWKSPIPIKIFKRKHGRAGIRNELWVVPTVGCINGIARNIIEVFKASRPHPGIDGIYAFPHPYGCSQLGQDHERTRSMLQNLALHPNAGGVLVLGLGCENNQINLFKETLPADADFTRLRFLEAQSVADEVAAGVQLLEELYAGASADVREEGSWKDIVVGLECGGSDSFSGITANPLIGEVSDYVTEQGGTTVLTEVPEMFGAENILMEQCRNKTVFHKTVEMITEFKNYYLSHHQPVYENPSPGNRSGGITTLEEKSLGCIRKA